jgi:lipase
VTSSGAGRRGGRVPIPALHVYEWGDAAAAPVVCLHGVAGHGGRFRRLAEDRLATRYHVLAPDLRGHGRSPWEEPWTLAAHVEDLAEAFPQPAAWIGHSFGGRLVAELVARHPRLVERAVLLDPALVVPPDYAQMLSEQELVTDASFASVEDAVEQSLAGLLRRPTKSIEAELRDHLVRDRDGRYRFRYSRAGVAAAYLEVAAPPPAWERAAVPTLVIAGAASKFVSVGEAELYRSSLGELFQLVIVPGGHMVLWDAFEETAAAVERFLAA